MATLVAVDMGASKRLRVGVYDLEVLTLPRTYISDVRIEQGQVTEIALPRAGVLNILPAAPGPGSVFLQQGDELVWVADLDPKAARTQMRLQPGTYLVTYRSQFAKRTELSISKEARIESGRSTSLNF